jgi:hypothetical protein
VTTQDPKRQKALDVADKSVRVTSFHANTLNALSELLGATGLRHPGELRPHHIVKRIANGEVRVLSALFPDLEKGELLEGRFRSNIFRTAWPMAQAESFAPLYSLSAALSGNSGTALPADASEANKAHSYQSERSDPSECKQISAGSHTTAPRVVPR